MMDESCEVAEELIEENEELKRKIEALERVMERYLRSCESCSEHIWVCHDCVHLPVVDELETTRTAIKIQKMFIEIATYRKDESIEIWKTISNAYREIQEDAEEERKRK